MTKRVIKEAFIKSIPVLAGYFFLGIGFGILLRKNGYGLVWSFVMSVGIYAGSMQYVGASLLAAQASIITTAITTVAVNARHVFYSISMINRYKDAGKKKPYLIFSLTDETYSLLCDGDYPEGENPHTYRFFVSLFDQCYWVIGCVAGSWLGAVLPFPTTGIDFVMTALFTATMVEQWHHSKDHRIAITGLASTLVCLLIFGRENFLIPSMLVITGVLTLLRKSIEKKEETANA